MQIHREIFIEKPGKIAWTRARKSETGNSFKQHNGHTIWVASSVYSSLISTPKSTMIVTGIISDVIYTTDFQNKPNVALHSLKGFSGLFALNT